MPWWRWTIDGVEVVVGGALCYFGEYEAGTGFLINGVIGFAEDTMIAIGSDSKSATMAGNFLEVASGLMLYFSPETKVLSAVEMTSGLLGQAGGHTGEEIYYQITGERSDVAFVIGSGIGNIAGGIAGGYVARYTENLAKGAKSKRKWRTPAEVTKGFDNSKPIKSPKGLIGKDFENYLNETIGGNGSFTVDGREFDGGVGNRWREAKSGDYWKMLKNNAQKLESFKSSMGQRLRIATENGATFELFSNVCIPDWIKEWLLKKGITFTELLG